MTAFLLTFLLRSTLLGVLGLLALRLLSKRSPSLRHVVAVGTIAGMVALPLVGSLAPPRTVELAHAPVALTYLAHGFAPDPASPSPSRSSVDVLAYVWAGGALLLSVRLGLSLRSMSRRARGARWLRLDPTIRVAEDGTTHVPMAVWPGRPVVLLPKGWTAWSIDRLGHVLSHEKAHIRRGDWFTQVFVHAAAALMWPSPVVHVLSWRSRVLAEQAADDLVISGGADPCAYASSLLAIARTTATPAGGIPMASASNVSRRIEMILSDRGERRAITRRSVLVVGVVVAVVSGIVATGSIAESRTAFAGRFGQPTPLMILTQEDVQADLGLSADQVLRIETAERDYREHLRASPADRDRIAVAFVSELDGALSQAEWRRLREIFVQWRGYDAVLDPSVQSEIGISAEQRVRIKEIAIEFRRTSDAAKYHEDLGRVLTDAQAAKLAELGGRAFKGRIRGTIWSHGG